MEPHQIIERAGRALADPVRLTTGSMARDQKGREVDPTSRRAVAFCVLGVLYAMSGAKMDKPESTNFNATAAAVAEVNLAASRLFKMTAVRVNDDLGHEAVVQCLRTAWKGARIFREREA